MRKTLFGVIIAAPMFFTPDTASADPYKWCAVQSEGGTNCGFVTVEQCRASISGIGGFCDQLFSHAGKTIQTKMVRVL